MGDAGLRKVRGAIDLGAGGADPLGAAESRLVAGWIEPTVGPVTTVFGPPAGDGTEAPAAVHLTLLGVAPMVSARVSRQPEPIRMVARYLVTARGATRAEADRLIVALGFGALGSGRPEAEREDPAPELWLALGVPARPALIIREVLEQSRDVTAAPLVRQPLVAQWSPSRTVVGRVIGPRAVPIAGARIEVTALGLTAHSDHRGDFSLAGVPLGPPYPNLTITAKGVQVAVRADPAVSEPLLISLPLPES